jgi:hypothetical protein
MEGLRTEEKQDAGKSLQDVILFKPVVEEFLHVDYASTPVFSKEYIRNGITIGVSKNLDEIAAIRPLWDQMQKQESSNIPDTDYNKYVSIIKSMDGKAEPFIMYLKKDETPLAMVIGRIEVQPLHLRLGYLTLIRPRLKCLTIVYGGIMGKPDESLCHTLISELKSQLKAQQADVIFLHYLKTDTIFYRVLRSMPCYSCRQVKIDKHWRMAVPDAIDKFYSTRSRGHRHNLRRAISRFEQEYDGDIRYVNYTSEKEVTDFLKTAAHISEKTYQHALKEGLVNDERTRARIKADAAKGWFRGHIAFAGNKPCAFQLGLHYENIYYMINMGYDPAFKSYNPGLVLFLKVLEGLCEDPSIELVDFYFGDAEYKNRYGTEYWQEANIYMFAPKMYPMFINALQVTTLGMNACLKYIVNKMDLTDRIKRQWRNLLSARSAVRKKPVTSERVWNSKDIRC